MSKSSIHLAVAKKIQEKYNLGDNFLLGNIAPDAWRGISTREKTHFHTFKEHNFDRFEAFDGNKTSKNSIVEFIIKYSKKLSDEFILGYLTHLLTDGYFEKNLPEFIYGVRDKLPTLKMKNGGCLVATYKKMSEIEEREAKILGFKLKNDFNIPYLNNKLKVLPVDEITVESLNYTIDFINVENYTPIEEDLLLYDYDLILKLIDDVVLKIDNVYKMLSIDLKPIIVNNKNKMKNKKK